MSIPRNLSILADNVNTSGVLNVSGGGTGLATTPANGALDIGNGTGFTRTTLTGGTGISVTNGAGSITIDSTSTSLVLSNPLTVNTSKAVTFPTTGISPTANYCRRIALDANRDLLIISAGSAIYAIVYNASGDTFGSVVTVRNVVGAVIGAISVGTDKTMVVSCNNATALEAVILSTSGTTITVNTTATLTLAGNIATSTSAPYYQSLVAIGTSYVLSYGRATTTSAILAFTVSGTTVTIGTETALTAAVAQAAALYVVSSSVVLCLNASATVFYATPYSVSGTTLTVGTGATTTVTNAAWYPTGAFASGQWGAIALNTNIYGFIVSVSTTVATISTAQLTTTTAITSFAYAVSSDKLLFADMTGFSANVLTNTAGVASAGTAISVVMSTTTYGIVGGTILFGYNSATYPSTKQISISGSNAVISVFGGYANQSTDGLLGSRAWLGSDYALAGLYTASKYFQIPSSQTGSLIANSDGTFTFTKPKIYGAPIIYFGASAWIYQTDTASTSNYLTKVTLT